jgi:hypothetical protein
MNIFWEMIKTLTMHNNDTTPRHIGVGPTHWVPPQCALVLCHCCAQRVQGSLLISFFCLYAGWILLICVFLDYYIYFCISLWNMLSSGFQHSVRQRALWKTDQCWNHMFQRSQILDELIPPAHTEFSVTFLLVFVLATFCWTKSLLCIVDVLSRVYSSVMFFKKIL